MNKIEVSISDLEDALQWWNDKGCPSDTLIIIQDDKGNVRIVFP